MIRPLHPFDVARHVLLGSPGGSNRVYTLDRLSREARPRVSMVDVPRLTVSLQSRGVCSLAWTEGKDVVGIGAARARSGPRTWEVFHLLLASDDEPNCLNLLNLLTRRVARRGGERVFIRLRNEDSLVDVARHCGFMPCGHEFLYSGRRRPTPSGQSINAREKAQADEDGVFRLYTACTPAETRFTSGMTFGQWSASREPTRGRAREFVYERDGQVRGWLKIIRRSRAGMVLTMVHPDDESRADALMDYGLEHVPRQNKVFCLVPEHQTVLQHVMWRRGFQVDSEYVTLVRSMVAPARDQERGEPVSIAST